MSIRKSKELSEQLENVTLGTLYEHFPSSLILTNTENGGTTLHSTKYHLFPTDLRIPPTESIAPLLTSHSQGAPILSPDLPTLLLFECVLVYIAPEASQALIQWFVNYLAPSSVLGAMVYEMFGLNDSFGAVMVENLKVPPLLSLCDRFALTFATLGQRCLVAGG